MIDSQERFDQLIAEQQQLKSRFEIEARELFKILTKEFFDKNPGITAVVWCQYTPYFNDGSPCVFAVHDPIFTNAPDPENVNPYGEYEGEVDHVWATDYPKSILQSEQKYHAETRKLMEEVGGIDAESCNAFAKVICSDEMESIMSNMFGDGVKVIATRAGFDVEDHDHD